VIPKGDLVAQPLHQNRAGHREYVRVNQTRQVRLNIVGFGKWRKHRGSTEVSHAAETADPFAVRGIDRRDLRPDNVIGDRLARHELRRQRKAANAASLAHRTPLQRLAGKLSPS
jgi:hypothetical protein